MEKILLITEYKKRYLDLLLLADEQESMIDRYLERGEMFAMQDNTGEVIAIAVVTVEGKDSIELKNMAVVPQEQQKGYGRKMIDYLCKFYTDKYRTLFVGTGNVPSTLNFYKRCGFSYSHKIPDFFTDNYDHPIYEDGILLTDMVYLKKDIG